MKQDLRLLFLHNKVLLTLLGLFLFVSTVEAASPRQLYRWALSGDVVAMRDMARVLYDGLEVKRDMKNAFAWWKLAAQKGDVKSMIDLGDVYLSMGKYKSAAKYFKMAADTGKANKRVKRRIASFPKKYRANLRAAIGEDDIAKQKKKKRKEVRVAAGGDCGESYMGVTPDDENINSVAEQSTDEIEWEEEGNEGSEEEQSDGDTEGIAREQSLDEIVRGELDNEGIAGVEKTGTSKPSELVSGTEELVRTNVFVSDFDKCRDAAEDGNAEAQYRLALFHAEGKEVSLDWEIAAAWFEKSAAQGYAPAQHALAECYAKGLGVRQSWEEAVSWYEKSAQQGNEASQIELDRCYAERKGTTPSRDCDSHESDTAVAYCEQSASQTQHVSSGTKSFWDGIKWEYVPEKIEPGDIKKVYGNGACYNPQPGMTAKYLDGSMRKYNENDIPIGYEPVIIHSGRPDNGTEWGQHVKFVPKSGKEIFADVLTNEGTLRCAADIAESCVDDCKNGDYGSAAAKGAIIGAFLYGLFSVLSE